MRAHLSKFLLFTLCCSIGLDWSTAFFFKTYKKSGLSNYNNYGYGYGHGYGYPGYNNYPSYSSYGQYGGGRPKKNQRTGRTYSQIARVLKPDPYLGLGAARYVPRAPYSPLWG
ncbi:uncharacterized protein Dwil_GK22756 [Drosophila willistoni]|uniref:Uncharacterized protein n=1 Tax=Drosophila willistoni TaxID=7260 RepID=A0A0Q9X4I2_DROWI|nr:shematrin-like protein 1 [Drosophila willistoni]KRF99760.1 uncharacterized protein Dwil_GK22756 [Drosophila willistoni]